MPDAALPEVEELRGRLDLVVLVRVVEPTRTDRHVAFGGDPRLAVLVALVERLRARRVVVADAVALGLEHRPAGLARPALLVADPADVGADVAEHHGVGLQLAHDLAEAREVVDLALAVRPLAAGAVEPDLEDRPVLREHLAQLLAEVLVVLLAGAVLRIVAVPRREVHAELEAALAARVAELAEHIALAALPRAVRDRVRRELGRPVAVAVVVLGGDDDALHARVLHDLDPLARVERGRVEDVRGLVAVAPLLVGEGVRAEVDEAGELHVLPRELARVGKRPNGRRRRRVVVRGSAGGGRGGHGGGRDRGQERRGQDGRAECVVGRHGGVRSGRTRAMLLRRARSREGAAAACVSEAARGGAIVHAPIAPVARRRLRNQRRIGFLDANASKCGQSGSCGLRGRAKASSSTCLP